MVGSIGDRLREERKRLGPTIAEIAKAVGKSSKTQERYELGERSPDAAYLAAIARHGVDVLYVVTGVRTPGHGLVEAVRRRHGAALVAAEVGAAIEAIEADETAAGRARSREDPERWIAALDGVARGLAERGSVPGPRHHAQLILAAYDLLEIPDAAAIDRVIRLVKAS